MCSYFNVYMCTYVYMSILSKYMSVLVCMSVSAVLFSSFFDTCTPVKQNPRNGRKNKYQILILPMFYWSFTPG